VIFKRSKSKVRFFRHTTTPGLKIGRYESGLEAIWVWEQVPHLLVIERSSYGAGENLVARIFRNFQGPKVLLWPKGECGWRSSTAGNEIFTAGRALLELDALGEQARVRAAQIESGEDVLRMLVAVPELHDMADGQPTEEDRQFVQALTRLLMVGRAARIHVVANIRQHVIYPAYLPQETRRQFSGLLVLGKTSDAITRQLGLPHPFNRPHGRLGDLGDDFWPLEVRTR
jgi:hypothetical protein